MRDMDRRLPRPPDIRKRKRGKNGYTAAPVAGWTWNSSLEIREYKIAVCSAFEVPACFTAKPAFVQVLVEWVTAGAGSRLQGSERRDERQCNRPRLDTAFGMRPRYGSTCKTTMMSR